MRKENIYIYFIMSAKHKPLAALFACLLFFNFSAKAQFGNPDHLYLNSTDSCLLDMDLLGNDFFPSGTAVYTQALIGGLAGSFVNNPVTGFTYCLPAGVSFLTESFYYVVCDSAQPGICDTVLVTINAFPNNFTDSIPVWPGDADHDGIVNNFDVLALGLAFGDSGGIRADQTITFDPKSSSDWGQFLPNGTDEKHCDSDGNGGIDHNDTLAISLNYNYAHNKTGAGQGRVTDPPLTVVFDTTQLNGGDTLTMAILLGSLAIPADSIYGVAFSLTYDPALLDSAYEPKVSYDNSWLPGNGGGNPANLISVSKNLRDRGHLEIGASRTNHAHANGYGQIGSVIVVIEDNLGGKARTGIPFIVGISDIRIIRLDMSVVQVYAQGDTAEINIENSVAPALASSFNMYPNPAESKLRIEFSEGGVENLTMLDLSGKKLMEFSLSAAEKQFELSLEGLSPGIYFIRVNGPQGQFTRKLIKR